MPATIIRHSLHQSVERQDVGQGMRHQVDESAMGQLVHVDLQEGDNTPDASSYQLDRSPELASYLGVSTMATTWAGSERPFEPVCDRSMPSLLAPVFARSALYLNGLWCVLEGSGQAVDSFVAGPLVQVQLAAVGRLAASAYWAVTATDVLVGRPAGGSSSTPPASTAWLRVEGGEHGRVWVEVEAAIALGGIATLVQCPRCTAVDIHGALVFGRH